MAKSTTPSLNNLAQTLTSPAKLEKQFHSAIQDLWKFEIVKVDNSSITIATLSIGILLLVLGVFFSRFLSKKVTRKLFGKMIPDRSTQHTLESVSFYIFLVFFTLFAMKMAHVPLSMFTVFGGALAIGFGFGSQNIVNNFISGIIMMIERPVKVGDFIDVEGTFGQVDNIGMRSTLIKSFGNKHIIVPNSFFLEKNVVNWTHDDKIVRLLIKVGVAYGSDCRKVERLLIEAAKSEGKVLPQFPPVALFMDFADSSLNFEVYYSINLEDIFARRVIESNIRFKIDELFKKEGVVIAFPQRDVHFYPAKPLQVEMLKS